MGCKGEGCATATSLGTTDPKVYSLAFLTDLLAHAPSVDASAAMSKHAECKAAGFLLDVPFLTSLYPANQLFSFFAFLEVRGPFDSNPGRTSIEFCVEKGHVERSFDLSVLGGGGALLRSSRLPQALFSSAKLTFLGFFNMYQLC